MNCFPCFSSKKSNTNEEQQEHVPVAQIRDTGPPSPPPVYNVSNIPAEANDNKNDEPSPAANNDNGARTFTFRELAMATKNFRQECLVGEGGFGKVYKATLQSGEVVAVKRLDRNGTQGNKEFLVEVLMLTLLHHPNLVNLIGYCADGDQRLLVYEYLPFGSVEAHLHDIPADKKTLSWVTRMKIASGAAQGLEYLHEKANPPIIYRNLKTSNVLLDEDFNPRLSDYGLAKLTQSNSKMHISPRVMGTYGYCAPEYERQGELTVKSDVYSFGVILLELITGRKALDTTRPTEEQNLVTWAKPIFRDPKRFPDMADPLLGKDFPERSLNQAVGVAAMCLQEEPSVRPLIGDVVAALSFLTIDPGPSAEVKNSEKEGDNFDHQRSDSSDKEDGDNKNYHDEKRNDREDESSFVSSEDEDSAHQPQQETKELNRRGSSSHHKVVSKEESMNFGRQGSISHHRNKVDHSTSSSSRSSSNNGSPLHSSRSKNNAAAPQERQNSTEKSLSRGMSEGSFAWSIGSSWRYNSEDGSARINSRTSSYMEMELHNDSLGSNMRQESSLRSNNERIGSRSRHSSNSGSEDGSVSSRD